MGAVSRSVTSATGERLTKDFDKFKKAFSYWQKELGLVEYTVYFERTNLGDRYAEIEVESDGKTATVRYNSLKPKDKHKNDTPQAIAFHEVCHLLLADFSALARARYATADDLYSAEESIVRTLENVIYRRIK